MDRGSRARVFNWKFQGVELKGLVKSAVNNHVVLAMLAPNEDAAAIG